MSLPPETHRPSAPAGRADERPAGRLVVAMSGGVDSSVAAWMLREAGHEVVGLFMRNGVQVEAGESAKKSCCSVSDARDARRVAAHLGVPFQAVDLAREFGSIVRYFLDEYAAGRTPNPCAVCNRDLKFDRLLAFADDLGAAGVATGHYARLAVVEGRVVLERGVDARKDQSYQLFCVAEDNLRRTWLPLGGLEKPRVRELAHAAGLRTAEKKDSQEVCFVPSNDYRQLLAERGVELHPGALVDTAGTRLGEHPGTEHFTIGQRRGHGVGGGTPLYVVDTEPATGTVVLGTRDECLAASLRTGAVNWIGVDPPAGPDDGLRCHVQYRYHCEPAAATVRARPGGWAEGAQVDFDEPQLAVAPGQGAAFYAGERLLGGGWIASRTRCG